MEYGSEYDWLANSNYISERTSKSAKEDWQLFRSGRDAIKALARILGRPGAKVLLPALCCESMILPFILNGYRVGFYGLNEDLSGNERDVIAGLEDNAVLLYMRYFGIRPFSAEFLQGIKNGGRNVVTVEDRTHDILLKRPDEDFEPDAVLASLRKWAALPDGGMLKTDLGIYRGVDDGRFADIRRAAMEKKSRYLTEWEPELKKEFLSELNRASEILDESGEAAAMGEKSRELLNTLDFEKIIAARVSNCLTLKKLLHPLEDAGKLRFLTEHPERSTVYFPVFVPDRNNVQRAMAQRDIYCPVIWPLPEGAENVCPVCRRVADSMLAIPCDQRYTEADMRFFADTLAEILA